MNEYEIQIIEYLEDIITTIETQTHTLLYIFSFTIAIMLVIIFAMAWESNTKWL